MKKKIEGGMDQLRSIPGHDHKLYTSINYVVIKNNSI